MDTLLYKKPIKSILKKIDFNIQKKLIKKVDEFFLLSKYMNDVLVLPEEKIRVIEGMHSCKSFDGEDENKTNIMKRIRKQDDNNFVVCYTGSTNIEYGIKALVDSYDFLSCRNIEIWIFGHGDYDQQLNNLPIDSRIRYFGTISVSEVHDIQKNVDMLINPRRDDKEYTKYSFPSKTREYLLSGTPILCYKLQGIPDEYDCYLNYIQGYDSKDIAFSIDSLITEYENVKKRAEYGKEFVLKYKSSSSQVKYMLDFIRDKMVN